MIFWSTFHPSHMPPVKLRKRQTRLSLTFSQFFFQTFYLHIISHSDPSQSNLAFVLHSGHPARTSAQSRPLWLISTHRVSLVPPHPLILTFSSLSFYCCLLLDGCQLKRSGLLGEFWLSCSFVSRNEKKVLKTCFPSPPPWLHPSLFFLQEEWLFCLGKSNLLAFNFLLVPHALWSRKPRGIFSGCVSQSVSRPG